MRLALSVGYWGMGIDADGQLAMALEAERLGYDSVWAAEAYGSDAATVLAWLAARTTTIGLGSAVFQIPARSPAMAAMTAATLDRLSGGRFRLGLGVSGPQVAEGWHGQRYARPLERTRDYVAVVRKALARERVAYRGETLERPLPIYLAAMGPRNLALAGEIADGCLGFLFDPAHGGEVRAALQEGAARGGRKLDTFDLAVNLQVRIDEDLDAARDAMRPMLALYVGGMGSRERNFYNELMRRYGFDEAADTVQELYLDGRVDGAAAALPPELIDAVTVCGPAGRVRERLDALREAGVTTLIAGPVSSGVDDATSQLRMLAGAAA